jgi:hypothetical protein
LPEPKCPQNSLTLALTSSNGTSITSCHSPAVLAIRSER